MTLFEAGSSDLLFYYETADPRKVVEADIFNMLIQPPASLFYNRGYGCGIQMRENAPVSAVVQVSIRSDIVTAFANRNRQVPDGSRGYPDRRAFASQSTIEIEADPQTGEMEVQVGYILAGDLSAARVTRIPGGK